MLSYPPSSLARTHSSGASSQKHLQQAGLIFSCQNGKILHFAKPKHWELAALPARYPDLYANPDFDGMRHGILTSLWTVDINESQRMSQEMFSFLIARHPFERILSAYRCWQRFYAVILTKEGMHFHLAQSRLPHCPRTVFLLLSLKDTVSTKYQQSIF